MYRTCVSARFGNLLSLRFQFSEKHAFVVGFRIKEEEEEEDIFSHQLTGTVHSNDNDFSVTGLYMIVQCLIDERAAKSAEALYK